jgi:hypothetical protein
MPPDPNRRLWRRIGKAFLDARWYIAYPANMLGPVLPPEFMPPMVAVGPDDDPDTDELAWYPPDLADGPAASASRPDERIP